MTTTADFDPNRLSISPLDEIDALDLREFLVSAQQDFWGGTTLVDEHAPFWFRQFDSSGLVARYQNQIVAYLLGVVPVDGPAYIHLVATHNDFRKNGIGRELYRAFIQRAQQWGKTEVQATTLPENSAAIAFHSELGFECELVGDYAGPDAPRVLCVRSLTLES